MKNTTPFPSLSLAIILALSALTLAPDFALAGKAPPNPFAGTYCDASSGLQITISKSGAISGRYTDSGYRVSGTVSPDGIMELEIKGLTGCLFDCGPGIVGRGHNHVLIAIALVQLDADGNLVGILTWPDFNYTQPWFLFRCG